MEIRKIDDLLNITGEQLSKLTKIELLSIHKKSYVWAQKRHDRAISALKEKFKENNNAAIPRAYRTEFTRDKNNNIVYEEKRLFTRYNKSDTEKITRSELIHEIINERNFLATKTSTIEGHEKDIKKFIKKLEELTEIKIPKSEYSNFFNVYNYVKSNETIKSKYELWRDVAQVVTDKRLYDLTPSELATYLNNKINDEILRGNYNEDYNGTELDDKDVFDLFINRNLRT
jgi:hypothetical protein